MSFKLHISHYSSAGADELPASLPWRSQHANVPPGSRSASGVQRRPAGPGIQIDTTQRLPIRDVLSRDEFLREFEREKRRADRSKSPVSLVHWEAVPGHQGLRDTTGLLNVLGASCRETDTLGELGEGVVGVLLPNTSKEGVNTFVRKVSDRLQGRQVFTTVSTYPDDAFDGIASGQGVLDEASLFGDDATAPSRKIEDAAKRAIDVVMSLLILLALAPLMLATALAVALTSRGPVIFRQSRLGKGGAPFDFYKFRSMRPSNDDSIHREFVSSLIQGKHADVNQQTSGNPLFKIKNDPRVTPIGRFIRSTSIDELPQLFNVLKGDMSLVGPRPPLSYEAEQYQSWHLRRILEVRPGITGLWQVEGRSRVSFDEMVRMDLRYIKQRSLALDLKLLVKTVGVVLARQGAK